jgi:ketosteroid isomerase-like protein
MAIDDGTLAAQEALFAQAFASGEIALARRLYHPDVVYLSPTVRLFGWPARIEGVDRTLEFIALTVTHVRDVAYRVVESAVFDGGRAAFVHIHFDFTRDGQRLRSSYVVVYRYRGRLIAQQEVYYDPSGALERLADA